MTNPDELITRNARWLQEQEHELWPNKPLREFGHKDCRVCGPGPLGRGQVPSRWEHVFYKFEKWRDEYGISYTERKECSPEMAKVVSSEIKGSRCHSVMIDVDLPVRAIESSTPGHYHLYVDKCLSWWAYKRLLRALMRAGIIEKGYYKMSVKRKATHLRPPWLDKETS